MQLRLAAIGALLCLLQGASASLAAAPQSFLSRGRSADGSSERAGCDATRLQYEAMSVRGKMWTSKRLSITPHLSEAGQRTLLGVRGGMVETALSTSSLPVLKGLLQMFLTGLNVLCWSVPLTSMHHLHSNSRLLSLANAFSGGIFLVLSFSHLIPQSIARLATESPTNHALHFVLAGFMAMLLVEKVLFDANHHHFEDSLPLSPPQQEKSQHPVAAAVRLHSAYVLLLAMSIHSFFEAAALGMTTSRASTWLMAACTAVHQPPESLALVVAFLKSNADRRSIAAILFAFSVVGLLGHLAGRTAMQIASSRTEAVLSAVTAGTFLFIGATEIIAEEFDEGSVREKTTKFAAYCAGMLSMYALVRLANVLEDAAGG